MRTIIFILLAVCSGILSTAQYAPQAGLPGSTAISASSSVFTGWATHCTLDRGYLNIDTPSLGYTTSGDSSMALGPVDHYVVSLGDSGVATLTFAYELFDGPGPDFAVFENGFQNPANDSQAFLEFAFVEVSSDGRRFVRFPATSYIPINTQIPAAGVYAYANQVNNLAGKYITNYGTPFDLQELADSPGLDIALITHVRLVDVIGATSKHSSYDKDGRIINDPYPTQFPTGGFDLDAVGAIHQLGASHVSVNDPAGNVSVSTYPNPATNRIFVRMSGTGMNEYTATINTIAGKQLIQQTFMDHTGEIAVDQLPAGMYYLVLTDTKGNKWVEKIVKQ